MPQRGLRPARGTSLWNQLGGRVSKSLSEQINETAVLLLPGVLSSITGRWIPAELRSCTECVCTRESALTAAMQSRGARVPPCRPRCTAHAQAGRRRRGAAPARLRCFPCAQGQFRRFTEETEESCSAFQSAVGSSLVCRKGKSPLKRSSGTILAGTGPNAAGAYEDERQRYRAGV